MINKKGLILEIIESENTEKDKNKTNCDVIKEQSYTMTTVKIENDDDSIRFGREKGTYITIEMNSVSTVTDFDFESIVSVIANAIHKLVEIKENDCVLVVGIGNKEVSADSLGPKTIERIIVTRGLKKVMPDAIKKGELLNVCAINTNVFGVTGIESAEIIKGVTEVIKPDLTVVVDAFSTKSEARLCKTIQISDSSVTPGSGVGNARERISDETANGKIITIGMPTVMNVEHVKKNNFTDNLVVIPMNIDTATDSAAKMIAFSLNKAFHYNISTEEILKFLY